MCLAFKYFKRRRQSFFFQKPFYCLSFEIFWLLSVNFRFLSFIFRLSFIIVQLSFSIFCNFIFHLSWFFLLFFTFGLSSFLFFIFTFHVSFFYLLFSVLFNIYIPNEIHNRPTGSKVIVFFLNLNLKKNWFLGPFYYEFGHPNAKIKKISDWLFRTNYKPTKYHDILQIYYIDFFGYSWKKFAFRTLMQFILK